MPAGEGPKPLLYGLIFPGFEMLDLYGPFEMLAFHWDVRLTATDPGPVRASRGPESLAEAAPEGPIDILLVPGGMGARAGVEDARLIALLDRLAGEARLTATVCTGSALLARTGRLDGRRATTNKRAFDWVRGQGPGVDWQESARWVVDGPSWTSSGVAAGMDMALALIADAKGREAADRLAWQVEYRWEDDPENDPFALAHQPGRG